MHQLGCILSIFITQQSCIAKEEGEVEGTQKSNRITVFHRICASILEKEKWLGGQSREAKRSRQMDITEKKSILSSKGR